MPEEKMMFDINRVRRLQRAYDANVKAGNEQFVFDGVKMLTAYVKYLLEYLEMELHSKRQERTNR